MCDIVKMDIIVPACCSSCIFLQRDEMNIFFCPFSNGDIDDAIIYQDLIDPSCKLQEKLKEQKHETKRLYF